MQPSVRDTILFGALFLALLALLLGVLWTWFWALRRLWLGIPVLSDILVMPSRSTPWRGSTILLTMFLYFLVSFAVVRVYQSATGRHMPRHEVAGERPNVLPLPPRENQPLKPEMDDVATVNSTPGRPVGVRGVDAPGKGFDEKTVQTQGELMLQSAIINSLLLLIVPSLVLPLSGARLADLGLDIRDWPRQVFYGVRAGFLITPVVFAIQSLAVQVWRSQKHPLEQMVMERFTPGAALLAVFSALVLAPLVEEMLFRGLLQQWIAKRLTDESGSAPESMPYPSDSEEMSRDWEYRKHGGLQPEAKPSSSDTEDGAPDWEYREPGVFQPRTSVEETNEGCRQPESTCLVSIIITSLLFACMHYPQWPAPIAIFVLALWLGTVYQRSRSLITAIALHATFNSFSTLLLLLEALSRKIQAVLPQVGAWFLPHTWF